MIAIMQKTRASRTLKNRKFRTAIVLGAQVCFISQNFKVVERRESLNSQVHLPENLALNQFHRRQMREEKEKIEHRNKRTIRLIPTAMTRNIPCQ